MATAESSLICSDRQTKPVCQPLGSENDEILCRWEDARGSNPARCVSIQRMDGSSEFCSEFWDPGICNDEMHLCRWEGDETEGTCVGIDQPSGQQPPAPTPPTSEQSGQQPPAPTPSPPSPPSKSPPPPYKSPPYKSPPPPSKPTTEPFGNLFNMNQFYRDRNTMILIIVVILFFMYKDEIMKSNVVKSLKKFLKKMLK